MTFRNLLVPAFLILSLAGVGLVVATRRTAKPPLNGFTILIKSLFNPQISQIE